MTKENEKNEKKEMKKQKKKYTLEELLSTCTPENKHEYIEFGRVGRELL